MVGSLSVCLYLSVYNGVTLCTVALRVGVGFESCIVVFPAGHFIFTSSVTCAVGCIIQLKTHSDKPNRQNFRVWKSHWQRGHVTMAIPDAAFSVVRFCSYTVRSAFFATAIRFL